MKGKRATIIVEVDLDQVPGWGYDPEDFAKLIRKNLEETVPHYNPSVKVTELDSYPPNA